MHKHDLGNSNRYSLLSYVKLKLIKSALQPVLKGFSSKPKF